MESRNASLCLLRTPRLLSWICCGSEPAFHSRNLAQTKSALGLCLPRRLTQSVTIVVLSDKGLSPKLFLGVTEDRDGSELITGGWRASKFTAASLWPHPHSAIWVGAYQDTT